MTTDSMASFQPQPSYRDEHEAFAASRSSEHVYVPIDDRSFSTLDKHAETIEMDAKLPLVGAVMITDKVHSFVIASKLLCSLSMKILGARYLQKTGPCRGTWDRKKRAFIELGETSRYNEAQG